MEKPKLPQAARLLMHLNLVKPVIANLINWLDESRNKDEELVVFEWTDHKWYIEIKDRTVGGYPHDIMIGFTVDLDNDRIFWTNDKFYGDRFPRGGNCFCRSERWFRKLRKQYPNVVSDRKDPVNGNVHDYRSRKQKQPV